MKTLTKNEKALNKILCSCENDTLKMIIVALRDINKIDDKFLIELCTNMKSVKGKLY